MYILFRYGKSVFLKNSITLLETVIGRVIRIKYLGVSLSEDITLAHDIDRQLTAFYDNLIPCLRVSEADEVPISSHI